MQKVNFIIVVLTVIPVIVNMSCNETSNPINSINIEELSGTWELTKEITYVTIEIYEDGFYEKDSWIDTVYVYDTCDIIEIDKDFYTRYYHSDVNPYYTKWVLAYTLTGNVITGHEFFNGHEDVVNGYDRWSTKVKSVTSNELIIQYIEEFYEIEGQDWDKGIGTIDYYYTRYEGTIPPPTWPDSMPCVSDCGWVTTVHTPPRKSWR